MQDITVDFEKLPKASTVISEIVANGDHKHVFKQIYGKCDATEVDERKKIFEITLFMYEKRKAKEAEAQNEPFRAKVLKDDYETERMAKAVA